MRAESADRVPLTRELWGAVLAGLHSDHPAVRDRVYAAVLAIGPREWDEDLETPGALVRRLADIGTPGPRPATAQAAWISGGTAPSARDTSASPSEDCDGLTAVHRDDGRLRR
ncbi:hypothetical protein SAMN04489712_1155 [Thermomonospora echinospora]|uniref:Uncharacterized protein n=1 Tax=Thermomonospora echinospora TaxID=1992 RepID=A0A1H6DC88_9ACTN|nr:hypothetical protein [Thermomonospora echinospora]SEG82295.1 hypothetical protein SAMN04489712_1155 [Thermomonospora echinospora]